MDEIPTGVSSTAASSETSSSAGSPPAQAVSESSSSGNVTTTPPSQDNATQAPAEVDPLAGIPSLEEVQTMDTVSKEAFLRLRGEYDKVKPQFTELETRFKPFESISERFTAPEEVQRVLDLHDSLIGWENDSQTGEPIPSTQAGAQKLSEQYPQHADFLAADLLQMETVDQETGRRMPRIDLVLESLKEDPLRRQHALQILGGVEPGSLAPQWQPTDEQLAAIPRDPSNPTPEEKALQEVFRNLPYDDREALSLNPPDYIRKTLAREKLTQDLERERSQTESVKAQEAQQREQTFNQQAQAAGQTYVDTQLKQALTTFHEAVVSQCNFIEPLDPTNLPSGMSPEQANQMNQQIAAANKSDAAQITGLVVSLFNPQTREYVLPLLKEIGAVDDKMLGEMERVAGQFGNNGRNYGFLNYRGQLQGNGYQPGPDVTQLGNEASKSLKLMVHYANQIKGKLIDARSQFFSLKATGHNQTLNGTAAVRPSSNGTGFDPTTAPAQRPQGWATRAELERQYGA
jgi:hypothetical protein